eukprot:90407-Pyramimonas_sp.AAC.1
MTRTPSTTSFPVLIVHGGLKQDVVVTHRANVHDRIEELKHDRVIRQATSGYISPELADELPESQGPEDFPDPAGL